MGIRETKKGTMVTMAGKMLSMLCLALLVVSVMGKVQSDAQGNRKLLMGSAAAAAEHGALDGFEKVFTKGSDFLTTEIQGVFAPPGAGKRRLLQFDSLFSGDIGGFFGGVGVDALNQAFSTGSTELANGFGNLLNGRRKLAMQSIGNDALQGGEQVLEAGLDDSTISITDALTGDRRKLLLGQLFSDPGEAVLGAENAFGRRKLSQLLSASSDSILKSLTGHKRKLLMGSAAAAAEHGALDGFEKVFTKGSDFLTTEIQGVFAPPGAGKRRLLQFDSLFSGDIGGFFGGVGVDAL